MSRCKVFTGSSEKRNNGTRMHSSRMRAACSGQRLPKEHGTRDRDPLEGTWDQVARQEVTSYRDPPVNRMTDMCKNITFPQTSFEGGKNEQSCLIGFDFHVSYDVMRL